MHSRPEPSLHFLSYALAIVGYMTLMLTMPLTSAIASSLQVKTGTLHLGISLLYFLFSLSAILLSMLSDIFGAYRILKYAQLTSIAGLALLANAQEVTVFYLGCVLVGSGTGCYSSIGRSVMLRHSHNPEHIKKRTAILSLAIIVAPILSFTLARSMIPSNWRYAYYIMMIIELTTLFFSQYALRGDYQPLTNIRCVLHVWLKYISTRSCLLNMLSTGVGYALILQTIIGNFHNILKPHTNLTYLQVNLLAFGLSVFYIIGIATFRKVINSPRLPFTRIILTSLLPVSLLLYIFHHSSPTATLIALYGTCYIIGFLNPLSSSFAMAEIKEGQGMASALLTFSFAFTSAMYSFIQGYFEIPIQQFLPLSLGFSFFALFTISILLKKYQF
ncbi:MFS transporter [Microbulbifer epialgicus]|uniref:MFS transporter n=1 Tax=Microbulbifer epialgicus TaxID=393907 RepID=A0ABV4P469_9GAMM